MKYVRLTPIRLFGNCITANLKTKSNVNSFVTDKADFSQITCFPSQALAQIYTMAQLTVSSTLWRGYTTDMVGLRQDECTQQTAQSSTQVLVTLCCLDKLYH